MLLLDLPDYQATQQLGMRLGQLLPAGSTILLEGDLGAGKTTLVQGIGKGLGIEVAIVSPTFTLINEYPEGRVPLYHFDLYRLEGKEIAAIVPELYWEGIEVPLGITAIEWAQRLPYLPDNYLKIHLRHSQQQRQAEIELVGERTIEFLKAINSDTLPAKSPQDRHIGCYKPKSSEDEVP
jgi:tRNA threonylcarbamoyladenosine biosynthesis protein TsaE